VPPPKQSKEGTSNEGGGAKDDDGARDKANSEVGSANVEGGQDPPAAGSRAGTRSESGTASVASAGSSARAKALSETSSKWRQQYAIQVLAAAVGHGMRRPMLRRCIYCAHTVHILCTYFSYLMPPLAGSSAGGNRL
jgi:hypothetical protein